MRIRPIGPNQTELELGDLTIFFSYRTPVAYNNGSGFFRTEEHYSPTTSRHINKWLDGAKAVVVPQAQIDTLVNKW